MAQQLKSGRQQIWDAIRATASGFSVDDVVTASGAKRRAVSDYLRCLVPGGVVAPCQDGTFVLIKDSGIHPPHLNRAGQPVLLGAGVENMWRSMCLMRQFSALDIAVHSTTDIIQVSEREAKEYCAILLRCRYLKVIEKAMPSIGRLAIYRLIQNTGPLPPQVQRVKQLYDPNTQQTLQPGGPA